MGRPQKEFDMAAVMDMITGGETQKDMAESLGCSVPTLTKKIAKLQEESGIVMQYRTLQSLELTQLQHRILNAITPEKIEEAPLRDLVLAFKILKDKELVSDGKPNEIKGLVEYLIHIEQEEAGIKIKPSGEAVDAEFSEESAEEVDPSEGALTVLDPGFTPKL